VQMPEIYGSDVGLVLRKVRDVKAPIVLFSSLPDEELARRTAEAGLDAWVSKAAGVDALVSCVQKLLALT